MATTSQVEKAIEELQFLFTANPNVVSAEPAPDSKHLGEHQALVGVRSLEAERRLQASEDQDLAKWAIPPSIVIVDDDGRGTRRSVEVTIAVFEVGDVRALALIRPSGPCPPGYSVGHPRTTAGTFGCLLRHSAFPDHRFILSNNHVLASGNRGNPGDPIYQPGPRDGGTAFHTTASLSASRALSYISANEVDAAVAEVGNEKSPPKDWKELVRPELTTLGPISGAVAARVGMRVGKVGRSSEVSYGTILSTTVTRLSVDYGPGLGMLTFINQIRTTPMGQPGDSGSVLVDLDSKCVVGLLFAGSNEYTFYNPIDKVLNAMEEEMADEGRFSMA